MTESEELTYKDSGVDVEAGSEAVRLLRQRLKSTANPLVLTGAGDFGGTIRMPPLDDAVLVSGTDGVGTKVILARELSRFDTIGIDCVAMSANDVSVTGAVPFFFLDYIVTAKVVPERIADIVAGVDEGCLQAQCVLLGGEVGEHPGHFAHDDDFDLAGFCVGIASRNELWRPDDVAVGDVLVGISSTGLHSNGFSLVRSVIDRHHIGLHDAFPLDDELTVGDVLLTPTGIYSAVLHDLGHAGVVRSAAHITGGGFPENIARALPDDLAAVVDLAAWRPPAVYPWLRGLGVSHDEMLRTFNCGLGIVLTVPPASVARTLEAIAATDFTGVVAGEVVERRDDEPQVRYRGTLAL
jgi:phosphoribosylformylglycinamidine cyclo-ligase